MMIFLSILTGLLAVALLLTIVLGKRYFARKLNEEREVQRRVMTENLSRELKTPIDRIQSSLEDYLHQPDMPAEQRATTLEHVYAQTTQVAGMLRDLVTVTSIERCMSLEEKGRQESAEGIHERCVLDLSTIIRSVLEDQQLRIQQQHLQLDIRIPDSMPIYGNATLLYSIFRNLLDNTLAYAGKDVTFKIHCFNHTDSRYYFRVSDSGVGIPSEAVPHVFERFYKVREQKTGSGLGLSIVKHAVLFHGGTITVMNRAEGGLSFMFFLSGEAPHEQQ